MILLKNKRIWNFRYIFRSLVLSLLRIAFPVFISVVSLKEDFLKEFPFFYPTPISFPQRLKTLRAYFWGYLFYKTKTQKNISSLMGSSEKRESTWKITRWRNSSQKYNNAHSLHVVDPSFRLHVRSWHVLFCGGSRQAWCMLSFSHLAFFTYKKNW